MKVRELSVSRGEGVTVAVAVTTVAPGVAGVRHAPGWKHPFPATVTVVETVKCDSTTCA